MRSCSFLPFFLPLFAPSVLPPRSMRSRTDFSTVFGTMPCSSLYAIWILRRRAVSVMAASIAGVITSPYMMTCPSAFRAALPTVWISEVSVLRNPDLSASRMATSDTSGMSRPSLSRLTPIRASNTPRRRSRMISVRSMVSTSWWIYLTFKRFFSRYSVRSSAILVVRVVTSTRCPLAARVLISPIRSSTCPLMGRTSISGSTSPVGRMSCSATCSAFSFSYLAGVAETNTV